MLPIDNILKPRRKYLGEVSHKIAIEQQHKSFILVHQNLKRAKKRQAQYADRNSQYNETTNQCNESKIKDFIKIL